MNSEELKQLMSAIPCPKCGGAVKVLPDDTICPSCGSFAAMAREALRFTAQPDPENPAYVLTEIRQLDIGKRPKKSYQEDDAARALARFCVAQLAAMGLLDGRLAIEIAAEVGLLPGELEDVPDWVAS